MQCCYAICTHHHPLYIRHTHRYKFEKIYNSHHREFILGRNMQVFWSNIGSNLKLMIHLNYIWAHTHTLIQSSNNNYLLATTTTTHNHSTVYHYWCINNWNCPFNFSWFRGAAVWMKFLMQLQRLTMCI